MHRALEATGTTNGIAQAPKWNSSQHAKTFAPENYEGVVDDAGSNYIVVMMDGVNITDSDSNDSAD